jgi:hypothetical protein
VDWAKSSPLNHPEYVKGLHREILSKTLNADYLRQGAAAMPPPTASKL